MAIYKSQLLTQASGSVGGLTFLHGSSGLTLRARSIPVNRRQPLQTEVRAIFGSLAAQWQLLTTDQKAAWIQYAAAVPLVNRLGEQFFASGLNHFIRSNTTRLYWDSAALYVPSGPLVLSLGATPVLSVPTAVVSAGGVLTIGGNAYISDAPTVAEPNTRIVLFITRPVSPGRAYVAGPYQYANNVVVAASALQPNVLSLTCPFYFDPVGGQQVGFELEVSREDGRLSSRSHYVALTTAAP